MLAEASQLGRISERRTRKRRRGAGAVLEWCLTAQHVLPFDMSCTARGLAAVGRATGDTRYADLARLAQAWFWGRNAARARVYEPGRGMVYDGSIDAGHVSRNSVRSQHRRWPWRCSLEPASSSNSNSWRDCEPSCHSCVVNRVVDVATTAVAPPVLSVGQARPAHRRRSTCSWLAVAAALLGTLGTLLAAWFLMADRLLGHP